MRPDYERYGHLGVPHEPQHTAAALDAAHDLTAKLTNTLTAVVDSLRKDDTVTTNTFFAGVWANMALQHLDDLRTNLADVLSEHMLDDDDADDLTADDGWHFGGVVTATPDGVVVSQADPDERDEMVICF